MRHKPGSPHLQSTDYDSIVVHRPVGSSHSFYTESSLFKAQKLKKEHRTASNRKYHHAKNIECTPTSRVSRMIAYNHYHGPYHVSIFVQGLIISIALPVSMEDVQLTAYHKCHG